LLWKESFNSDGQQCHQYQQNEQSPLLTQRTQNETTTYDVDNSGPGFGQAQKCGRD